ncbi:MAG: septum formation initiator family protein [Actinomycetota bacterium]|nr:septum formation initiator family protein [Geodermatophilaceae bacterium]MDQ3054912.1 septum formation initiator family protein [Actinomycetota bacterium]
MSSANGPGSRRGARRNGVLGTSRPDGRRSAHDRTRGSERSRGPERARGGGRAAAGELTRAQGRGRGPGDKRSTRGPGPTRATAAPQAAQRWTARLTGRAILLAAVVVLLILSLAYPLQSYLAQQATIDRLEAENSAAQQRVEDLRVRVDQLDDPAFIETQAQSRLQYVMPGDLLYVIDDSGQAQAVPGRDDPDAEEAEVAWFDRVLDSIDIADSGG